MGGAKMRKQLLCGVAAIAVTVAISGPIHAADIALKAPPAPVAAPVAPSWAGFYLGGHLGYGWSKMSGAESTGDTFAGDLKLNGGVAGVHWGYNWQFSQWVLGYESDFSGTFGQGWSKYACAADGCPGSFTLLHGELHGLTTMRARLGWAFDRTLIYATGGVAWGWFKGFVTSGSSFNPTSKTVFGGVVGGGVEWKYNQNVSFRLEALDYLFNKTWGNDSEAGVVNSITAKNVVVVRFGASYYFTDSGGKGVMRF
jgi:outer membrane immunogenic protein